jgi:hypothetical protein
MEHKCKKTDIKTTEKCELNRDEIIKALEIHSDNNAESCMDRCPYSAMRYCGSEMAKDALSLIKELQTLINTLHDKLDEGYAKFVDEERADTVREMQERIRLEFSDCYLNDEICYGRFKTAVDRIAKEMVEGNK